MLHEQTRHKEQPACGLHAVAYRWQHEWTSPAAIVSAIGTTPHGCTWSPDAGWWSSAGGVDGEVIWQWTMDLFSGYK